jgi:Right handed beta helix region
MTAMAPTRWWVSLRFAFVLCCGLPVSPAFAVNAIATGTLGADPATLCCLGVSLPILSGDDNGNAVATLRYREQGATDWLQGMPLLRVRPEQTSTESPPSDDGLPNPVRQFAGSVFGLKPGKAHEIEVTVTDPDGGGGTQTIVSSTAPVPRAQPAVATTINVGTATQLRTALANAVAGQVIVLAAGSYGGSFAISRSGTAANPIFIRGEARDLVTISAAGSAYGIVISGSYVTLENVTISGSTWGARVYGTQGVVIRRTRMTNVSQGINGYSGTTRGLYLCDNQLEGRLPWPDASANGPNQEGIAVTGQGHTICSNTISGFGDALGLHHVTGLINVAIDFYNNEVLWTSDDGVEIDYAHRNVRVFRNRITNAAMGVSFQPIWGGPAYVFRNVFVNMSRSPFKLNNDPSGFFIFNNTAVRTLGIGNNGSHALPSLGYTQADGHPAYAANFEFRNNLLLGVSSPAFVTTDLMDEKLDYNGWYPDGTFVLFDTWTSLADLKSRSPYEAHGRIVEAQPFASPVSLGADYTAFMQPRSVALATGSTAVDGGQVLPNITDGFLGAAPDLGAWESGIPPPAFGVRVADADSDGVPDAYDNCSALPNGDQRDSNGDGFGNRCDADLNNSGFVDALDRLLLRSAYGTTNADADFNGDGLVNLPDISIFSALYARPVGPGAVP